MKKKKKNCVQKEKRRRRRRRVHPRNNIFKILNYIYTEMIELLWIFLILQKKIVEKKKSTFRFVNKEIIR